MAYGAGAGPWEIEQHARNLSSWSSDGTPPTQPSPSPPDGTSAAGYVRESTLPMTAIATRVNALALPGIGSSGAWIDDRGPAGGYLGGYLCEFMAYHVMWYQELHAGDVDGACLRAGFTHVASSVPVTSATSAAEEALRALIAQLDTDRGI